METFRAYHADTSTPPSSRASSRCCASTAW